MAFVSSVSFQGTNKACQPVRAADSLPLSSGERLTLSVGAPRCEQRAYHRKQKV